MPPATRGETAPLLRARRCDAHDHAATEPCDEPLGSARFPFHPTARATPRWRKLVLHFFDDQACSSAPLGTCDLWRLEPQFRGAQAAADLKKRIPSAGRVRLLRGVCAVNRGRLLRLALLNLVATPLAALRPVLLLYLCRGGLSKIEAATANPREVHGAWEVYVPVTGIVITQLLLGLVRAHAASVAVLIYFQMSSSLSTLITERVVTSGTQVNGLVTPEAKAAPVGRKQRLTEITNMLSNDLVRVASTPLVTHSTWSAIVQLVTSLAVLVHVVEISWVVVGAIAVAFVVLLLAELATATSLVTRFESAFARRLNAIHESIMSIRMVKMNAWEDKMEHKILEARSRETSAANRVAALTLTMKEITKESPTLVTALIFAMSSTSSSTVTKATGISSLQVFTSLVLIHDCFRCAEKAKPALQVAVVARRAWKKFESFLFLSEKNPSQSTSSSDNTSKLAKGVITEMRGACMSTTSQVANAPPLLINVDWAVRKGELVVIHGPAGVGKSMLLGALLGEGSTTKVLSGSFRSPSRDCCIAYCPQDPWLQTLSIRDNILFGAAFDEEKYWTVVDACGLLEDLLVLPAGDATPVGPRGINLSSGQSARIALARACYADADLYLLDCPLANVDAVVQSEIFRKCIVELLMFKTVVIVTHNPEYIGSSFVDQLVEVSSHGVRVMNRVEVRGSKTRVMSQGLQQTRRMRDYLSTMSGKPNDRSLWITPMSNESEATAEQIRDSRTFVTTSVGDGAQQLDTFISKAAILKFIFGGGPRGWAWFVATLSSSVLWGVTSISRDVWILSWQSIAPVFLPSNDSVEFVAVIYGVLAFACVVLGLLTQASALAFNVESTSHLFSRMVRAILRATMTFFYTTPLGDMLNPFFTDLGEVDMILPQYLSMLVSSSVTLLGRAIVLGWVLGPFAAAIIVAANAVLLRALSIKFFVGLTHLVRASNGRQLSVMAEVLDGETVLRAFGEGHIAHQVRELEAAIEIKSRIEYFTDTFNSFAILQEEALLAAQSLGLLAVMFMRSVTPAQFLLASFYIIMTQQEYISRFGSGLINTCDQLYSIERLRSFGESEIETELSSETPSCIVDTEWPNHGEVIFDHVDFTYSNHHDVNQQTLALRDVSFTLRGGEKIGVVGRTGSGKSSLAMALLRVHPLRSGRISLDGVDLGTVPLTQLRRSVTMIPQSPTFYRCSVRDYLDPFQEFDDARLWRELLTVELGTRVQSLEEELLDNGENWSLGQRQLLCFARALLKPSRVVVLDEAFSCVDQACQEKILRVLRDRFASSTVVLITHRLDQILEFDRILVMRGGRVVESGSASELASDAGSVFYEFLETSLLTF